MMKEDKTIKPKFFYGATPFVFEKSRELRKNMTAAEKMLWSRLKERQINGFQFRRQHPIGNFIADFFCHKLNLVVEVDGGIHNTQIQKERDESRDYVMEQLGLKVLRVSNEDVENNLEVVLEKIKSYSINKKIIYK